MNAGGAVLLVGSIWLLTQVLGGQMLQRLKIVSSGTPSSSSTPATPTPTPGPSPTPAPTAATGGPTLRVI